MNIPQANPKAENDELSVELNEAIQRVLNSGRYILGPEVEAFEKEFASYIGVAHAVSVGSGTDAIALALRALGVGPGDEVITVSHTAVATVSAVEQCGAVPVLADIDPLTFTLDPSLLEGLLTPRTKVIIPVHLYGHPADLEPILAFARTHGLYVLEDCAQAHGAAYHGKKAGSWGDIAAFSFYPTKNLGALGDGGMVVTSDAALAERAALLRQYGWKRRYISDIQGFNSRLDELQAAMLRVKLRHLDDGNARRRHLAQVYTSLLKDRVVCPQERQGCLHVYHLYVVRVPQRDRLQDYLKQNGVGSLVHYPAAVHQQPAYAGRLRTSSMRFTEQAVSEILSLPLFPQLAVEHVHQSAQVIVRGLEEFANAGRA